MAYRSKIDRFDMERGDALTLTLETATELAALPCEIAAPIIYALLSWFAGGDVPTLPDPRDNALLLRLVVHQKQNAAHRADVLATKRENRMGKGRQETPATESGENARQRPSTGATDKIREDKSSKDEDLSCHAAPASSRAACASPPAGSSACALPAAPAATKECTAVYCDGHFYSEDVWGVFDIKATVAMNGQEPLFTRSVTNTRFAADPVSALMEYPDFEAEEDKAKFRATLIQRFKANAGRFTRIAWEYIADAHRARADFIKAVQKANACEDCHCDYCAECNHNAWLKHLAAQYDKDFACDVFAKNLLGRLKVLKTSKPKK